MDQAKAMRSKLKRFLAFAMSAVLFFSSVPLSGYAEGETDKTALQMKAEKDVYREGEVVKTTISVTNGNDGKLSDVKLSGIAPEGYAVRAVTGPAEVSAGGTVNYTIEFEDTNVIYTYATKQKVDISTLFNTNEKIAKYAITDKAQKKLASVSKKGVVTCKKPGEVTVTAYRMEKVGKKKTYPEIGTYTLRIETPKINLEKKTLKLAAGSTASLEASSYITADAAEITSWHTSNRKVVDIDEKTGTMTVKKKGNAKITAWYGDKKKAAKYSFTVKVAKSYLASDKAGSEITPVSAKKTSCTVKINGKDVEFGASFDYNINPAPPVIVKYTVTFDTKGGSTVAPIQVVQGEKLNEASVPTPTKANATFIGWYTDEEYTDEYDFNRPVNEDFTLYAKWAHKYTVKFNTMGGNSIDDVIVTEGDTLDPLSILDPEKADVCFAGWYTDEGCTAKFDFETPIASNLTLYACWKTPIKKTVATQAALETELSTDPTAFKEITFASDAALNVSLGTGNYPNTTLIINAPATHFENKADFNKVVLVAVSNSTYVEGAGKQRLVISSNYLLKLETGSDHEQQFIIDNKGIFDLYVKNKLDVIVKGTSPMVAENQRIKITVAEAATGSKVHTAQNIDLSANGKITLILDPTAFNNIADIKNIGVKPDIKGYGEITVTDNETGAVTTEIADSTGYDTGERVVVNGVVEPANAEVYLVNHHSDLNMENFESEITAKTPKAVVTNGRYSFNDVKAGNYYIVTKASGYVTEFKKLSVSILTMNGNIDMGIIHMTTNQDAVQTVNVKGTITDIQDGRGDGRTPIDYKVKLRLFRGIDVASGTPVKEVESTVYGTYDLGNVKKGNYTLQISQADDAHPVVPSVERLKVSDDMFGSDVSEDEDKQYEISAKSGNADLGEVSFVLWWDPKMSKAEDNDPDDWSDIDSHLVGPGENGKKLHTWYKDKYNYGEDDYFDPNCIIDSRKEDEIPFAGLDRDDVTFHGPETTTIYKLTPGEYDFYLFNFSNQDPADLSMTMYSESYVQIFVNGNQITTYDVPYAEVGPLWHVCTYDSKTGMITPVNRVYQKHKNGNAYSSVDIGLEGDDYMMYLGKDTRENIAVLMEEAEGYLNICNAATSSMLSAKISATQNMYEKKSATVDELQNAEYTLSQYLREIMPQVSSISCENDESFEYNLNYSYDGEEYVVYSNEKTMPEFTVTMSDPDTETAQLVVIPAEEGVHGAYTVLRMTDNASGITIDKKLIFISRYDDLKYLLYRSLQTVSENGATEYVNDPNGKITALCNEALAVYEDEDATTAEINNMLTKIAEFETALPWFTISDGYENAGENERYGGVLQTYFPDGVNSFNDMEILPRKADDTITKSVKPDEIQEEYGYGYHVMDVTSNDPVSGISVRWTFKVIYYLNN